MGFWVCCCFFDRKTSHAKTNRNPKPKITTRYRRWFCARPGFEGGINWVVGPFDKPQHAMPPLLYLFVCMAAYPVVLYAPSHFALRWIFRPTEAPAAR